MMRLVAGSLAAAILMFVLGFVFYGVLGAYAYASLDAATAQAVQAALGSHLSATGTYMVPADEAAWGAGPGAVVNFVAAGGAPGMGAAMISGFIHFAVTALILGAALRTIGGDFQRQMRVVVLVSLAAAVFTRLGDPLWFGFGWQNSLFTFTADVVMLIAGGFVLARWFTSAKGDSAAVAAAAPAE